MRRKRSPARVPFPQITNTQTRNITWDTQDSHKQGIQIQATHTRALSWDMGRCDSQQQEFGVFHFGQGIPIERCLYWYSLFVSTQRNKLHFYQRWFYCYTFIHTRGCTGNWYQNCFLSIHPPPYTVICILSSNPSVRRHTHLSLSLFTYVPSQLSESLKTGSCYRNMGGCYCHERPQLL